MQPRPESRVESLEKRTTTIEAVLLEMSSDTAEELKVIRQEIKQGHIDIGKSLDSHAEALMQEVGKRFDRTDQRLTTIEARLDTTATKDDIARLEGLITQLLQQKSGE